MSGSSSRSTGDPKVVSPPPRNPRPAHSSPAAPTAGKSPAKSKETPAKKMTGGKGAKGKGSTGASGSGASGSRTSPGSGTSGSGTPGPETGDSGSGGEGHTSKFLVGDFVWAQAPPSKLSDDLELVHNHFYVAHIQGLKWASTDSFKAKWVKGGQAFSLPETRIMCELSEREKEIVFDGPTLPGKGASVGDVEHILGGGRLTPSTDVPAHRRGPDGQRQFPDGLAFTAATCNWGGKDALEWLALPDSSFEPLLLAGALCRNPSYVPDRVIQPNKNDPSLATFGNCTQQLLLLVQQLEGDRNDPLFQKLYTLAHILPSLLLRVNKSLPSGKKVTTVQNLCKRFLNGKWKKLFDDAVKAIRSAGQRKHAEAVTSLRGCASSTLQASPPVLRYMLRWWLSSPRPPSLKCLQILP